MSQSAATARRRWRRLPLTAAAAWLAAVLVACSGSPVKRAEDYAAQEDWIKAVLEYRKALAERPNDVEYRSRLKQVELKAADYYYQRGVRFLEQGSLDAAIVQFQQGLAAIPDHSKLQQAMGEALARKESAGLYAEAASLREAGRLEDARRTFQRALDIWPEHKEARAMLAELRKQQDDKLAEGLPLASKAPITLNFRQTDLKQGFEFLAKAFGVNVIFDDAVRSVPVTLFAKDVTFEQGLNLLLTTSKTFHKRIGANTILVAPDTKEKRGQYEDHLVRTFYMNSVRAKEMADILRGLVAIKKIIINDQLNTVTIRDTEEVIKLSERIIDNNDRKPAEMMLDVEILEVNRNKAERIGLDFGTYAFSVAVPPSNTVPLSGSVRDAISAAATLTVPSITFRFFKQDVDAKTLANPKIRVLNGRAAKIHIGDRVPLRAATIVDATGQTRTTFDYKDIGIRLVVEPIIYLDNSAMVKMGLEVSALGENLGTANEPAFRIGTRNAETFMLLRDGETAILGGLIQDAERNNRVKVPGFGDIPAIGALFTSYDDSVSRTDVLLTITPRIVRGWDLPGRAAREFYSGSETVYSDRPLFANLETAAGAQIRMESAAAPAPSAPSLVTGPLTQPAAASPAVAAAAVAPPLLANAPAAPSGGAPLLTFSEPVYEVPAGQDFEIRLLGANLPGGAMLPLEILYNPQLMSYVSGARGEVATDSFNASAEAARGLVNLSVALAAAAPAQSNAVLARLVMRGEKPGISYLVYRAPAIRTASGEVLNAQVRAARVLIK